MIRNIQIAVILTVRYYIYVIILQSILMDRYAKYSFFFINVYKNSDYRELEMWWILFTDIPFRFWISFISRISDIKVFISKNFPFLITDNFYYILLLFFISFFLSFSLIIIKNQSYQISGIICFSRTKVVRSAYIIQNA